MIEIHVVKVNDSFGERLRWSNPDGSSHFMVDEETKQYVHTPTKATENDIWKQEMEERLARLERVISQTTGVVFGE